MLSISRYLNKNSLKLLDVSNRDEAIEALVDGLDSMGILKKKEKFYQAIIDREKIVSTGIGMGVAIPHAKLPLYNDFFIILGILQTGVDWNAIDGSPVRIIFMVGGPDDKQTQYLQILSALTMAVKDEERRKRILQVKTSEEVIELFKAV